MKQQLDIDRRAEVVKIIVDFMRADPDLGWQGIGEFDDDLAVELIDWMIERGVELK